MSELEGQCLGNPAILAGQILSLGMTGPPFDGMYVVSSARHLFETALGGYTTWFTVGGRQDRSLFALASGGGASQGTRPSVPGVVVGVVSDNDDPMVQGQVKVLFPWLSDTYVSAWAPTVQLGAGEGYGSLWLPEVGNEVLVAFDRGDVGHPYVIGNLYNGVAMPEPPASIQGAVANRRIMSRMRHMIQFDDGPDALGITITDGDDTVTIKMDAEEQAITITSAGQVTVEAAEAISFKSGSDLTMQVGGSLSITTGASVGVTSGEGFSVESGGSLSLVGTDASIEAPSVAVSAASITLGG